MINRLRTTVPSSANLFILLPSASQFLQELQTPFTVVVNSLEQRRWVPPSKHRAFEIGNELIVLRLLAAIEHVSVGFASKNASLASQIMLR